MNSYEPQISRVYVFSHPVWHLFIPSKLVVRKVVLCASNVSSVEPMRR